MPTTAELQQRYAAACTFKQQIDREAIALHLQNWIQALNTEMLPVRFIEDEKQLESAARADWADWANLANWAVSTAWAARAARAARAAWAAWANLANLADWAASTAWADWAASAAWATRATWDLSYTSLLVIGAMGENDLKTFTLWQHVLYALEAGAWLMFITNDAVWVLTLPTVYTDSRNRLHSELGAAFEVVDIKEYYWHGVRVPERIILRPDSITLEDIRNESNTEVRRVMLERYGYSRYIHDSDAKMKCKDEYGELYELPRPNDTPIIMVRYNCWSTEREYWSRVPPTTRTPLEGLAWKDSMSPDEYRNALHA